MTTMFYRADTWDRLNSIPEPATEFVMHCDEEHGSTWSHREWHVLDTAACPRPECPGRIDFAHARRHVSCPCDEVTAPEEDEAVWLQRRADRAYHGES